MSTATDTASGRQLRGRDAPNGDGAPARPRPRAALAEQLPRTALRRRDLGPARPPGARRFVDLMRERGVEVLLFHDLLAETLDDAEAREWLLSRRLRPEEVTAIFSSELIAWMAEMPADELATKLTGGVILSELPEDIVDDRGTRCSRPTSSSRRCRTSCSPATRAPGSTAASRSTRCTGRRARTRR